RDCVLREVLHRSHQKVPNRGAASTSFTYFRSFLGPCVTPGTLRPLFGVEPRRPMHPKSKSCTKGSAEYAVPSRPRSNEFRLGSEMVLRSMSGSSERWDDHRAEGGSSRDGMAPVTEGQKTRVRVLVLIEQRMVREGFSILLE